MTIPFRSQASRSAARLDELLLAAADEFAEVDARCADETLDRLADDLRQRVRPRSGLEERADEIVQLLDRERFRPTRSVSAGDALFHFVLRRRAGHPVMLAAACTEIARRAGLEVAPVRAGENVLVGVRHGGDTLAIDPARECASPPQRMAWMCPHELTFLALTELSRLSALEGRIVEAIHAAELRSALPVSAALRDRIGFEVDALRAQLN